ncbi:MAG: hypothetical protein SCARUB_02023 [Candidatus Scalindua rubra]|uniref:Uncharacterized protein n=1 Tax=Candidatus Scalindua rubra TaxID=1872076 RepID=A0A1E3XD17_9BACT|nr:MAG: hypothetical protein SCARUB_02023 [Candidatus Scalindua rubra]
MERLLKIDRRIIFVFVAIAVTIPLLIRFNLPVPATKEVKGIFDKIDSLSEASHVLIAFDYDPASKEELQPMALALLHHCFKRDVKVVGMTLNPGGTGLADSAITDTGKQYGKVSGEDYVFLGYKTGFELVMISMGENIYSAFPKDFQGNATIDLPALKGVQSLTDFDYVIDLASGASIEAWIAFGKEKYNFDLGAGCTAVIGPDMYPFLQAKQINGLMSGLKGAAEYETLIKRKSSAVAGMSPQSVVHVLVVLFVIFGNVLYFMSGRKK